MEITCSRCHQPVDAESCYCQTCGLPQLVYTSDANAGQAPPEKLSEAIIDSGAVQWRPALRAALLVAIPAGLLSSGISPVGILGLLWMSAAAAWAVTIYVRGQRSPWITTGAGARIGFVTGLLSAWVATATTGAWLYAIRNLMGQGKAIDDDWQARVARASQQWQAMSPDPRTAAAFKASATWFLTPEGHSGAILVGMAMLMAFMLAFAAVGGALGARLLARSRRSQV